MERPSTARRMWMLLEPVHAVIYYAPQARAAAAALQYSVETRWPSYFAWRLAPLGAPGPVLATATLYSFAPQMVGEYVPAVWQVAAATDVLAARDQAVDRALRVLLPDLLDSKEVREAADLMAAAVEATTAAGRPLAAANSDLPWPDQPHLVLWRAATILREHRGDGHIAALMAADLDPCESLVSFAATGAAPSAVFASRGWSEDAWAAARARLAARGWINDDGSATDVGRQARAAVERMTDELAAAPWRHLGRDRTDKLARLIAPLTAIIGPSGLLPSPSTLGMHRARPSP